MMYELLLHISAALSLLGGVFMIVGLVLVSIFDFPVWFLYNVSSISLTMMISGLVFVGLFVICYIISI